MELCVEDVLKEGESWSARFIQKGIEKFGDEHGALDVDDPQYHERISACIGCPHFGRVQPLPMIKLWGCTICQCPIVSKARMTKMFRRPEYIGESISIKEVILTTSAGESFVPEVVRCSDKSEDRWASIDQKYSDV